ncbi:MAG: antibiotic biosynthesis monooxygenase [Bacteroidota bacterium]
MVVTCVHIHVKEEFVEQFKEASLENHLGSIQEVGNYRFDVLQDVEDPTRFLLYEVFDSQEAIIEHKKTSHYLKWREKVDDWMAERRKGIRYEIIAPSSPELW